MNKIYTQLHHFRTFGCDNIRNIHFSIPYVIVEYILKEGENSRHSTRHLASINEPPEINLILPTHRKSNTQLNDTSMKVKLNRSSHCAVFLKPTGCRDTNKCILLTIHIKCMGTTNCRQVCVDVKQKYTTTTHIYNIFALFCVRI